MTKDKELETIYETDEYVKKYHSEPGKRIEQILSHVTLSRKDIVADYACGNGLLLDLIYKKIKSYIGVDPSHKFIRMAKVRVKKQKITNAQFVSQYIEDFSKNSKNTFSKAFALDFSEHIDNEAFLRIFKDIKSTLKKDGELILHTPNREYFLEIFKAKGLMRQIPGHIAVRSLRQYEALLKQCGFTKIKGIYLDHYNKLAKIFAPLKYLPLIGKFFRARLLIICR
jgi:cyclopropane fatty-acyl-phospholipid synthase-like methyltransferase